MHVVVLLMVFAANGGIQPIKPHEVLRFFHVDECISAKHKFEFHSDGFHAYECIPGAVVE